MKNIYEHLGFKNIVTFNVHAPKLLGSNYADVEVMGLLDVDSAKTFIDPYAMHVNVYPSLPEGTVEDDPASYQYVKVKHPNGTYSVLGVPWIDANTIETSERGTLTLTLNNIHVSDKDTIIRALSSNGFKVDTIDFQ